MHVTLSHGFKAPEFQLSREESEQLAKCIAEVQDAYGVSVSPKTQALANLCAAVGGAYIPRVMLYNSRKAAQNKPRNATQQQQQPQPQPQPQPKPQPQPQRPARENVVDLKTAETPGQIYGFGFTGAEPESGTPF